MKPLLFSPPNGPPVDGGARGAVPPCSRLANDRVLLPQGAVSGEDREGAVLQGRALPGTQGQEARETEELVSRAGQRGCRSSREHLAGTEEQPAAVVRGQRGCRYFRAATTEPALLEEGVEETRGGDPTARTSPELGRTGGFVPTGLRSIGRLRMPSSDETLRA
ncbi:MAG: hypothetical protein HY900_07035 [Deltaproteobacteria bacterium]|nr:hypothetical protein [Deltaproteobacteria bacterium]